MIWVIGLGLLGGPGCELVEQGVHVMSYKVCQCFQEHTERQRNRKWADQAWQAVCGAHPDLARSDDYAAGFKDGFAEHLWRGGNGEPPPLPPRKYRAVSYQTPSGYQAIESWFAGYRHGAEVAQEGGYRELVTGPSSLRSVPPVPVEGAHPPPLVEAPLAGEGKALGQSLSNGPFLKRETGSTTEQLPAPRPLEAVTPLPRPAARPTNNGADPKPSQPGGRQGDASPPATAKVYSIRLRFVPSEMFQTPYFKWPSFSILLW